jgi:hypothetical protein
MLKGETLLYGAPRTCPNCGFMPELKVYWTVAGYYIGTYCNCRPYSRESGYYRTEKEAEAAFRTGPSAYKRSSASSRVPALVKGRPCAPLLVVWMVRFPVPFRSRVPRYGRSQICSQPFGYRYPH